jgi:hypothetical protein
MKKALAVALIAAAAAAAGCASGDSKEASGKKDKNPAPCPPVTVLTDAARLIEFDGEQTLEDVAYSGEFVKAELQCRYFDDRPIDASLRVSMAFGRGPKGAENAHAFKYFVAVTRKDLEVIEKAEFGVGVKFDGAGTMTVVEDKVDEIVIPRASKDIAGTNFEIVVGFVLTPQQAIFNRSGKSLKFPEVQ